MLSIKDDITKICDILKQKQEEFGKEIYLISDEPYRELVYKKLYKSKKMWYDCSIKYPKRIKKYEMSKLRLS